MTTYLYVLSIGPVQGFIAAARRTRDLWIGSHLLSEISKAAARKISDMSDKSGRLIFPSLEKDKLKPLESPDAPNVANIILAELNLSDGQDPREIDQQVKEAAQGEWMQYAKGAKWQAENGSGGFKVSPLWDHQANDVLEFYSAWIQVPGDDYDYQKTRKKLMRLLNGRKSIRDFIQEEERDLKLPKSSLDGSRDTVIPKNIDDISDDLALKMRLKAGEQLCAVGLTKRLGGKRFECIQDGNDTRLEAFPSVVRIALDPWVRGIVNSGGEARRILDEIKGICKNRENIAQMSGKWSNDKLRYPDFPFDGHVLHISQVDSIVNASKKENDKKKKTGAGLKGWETRLTDHDRKALMEIRCLAERLQKSGTTRRGEKGLGFGKPERYYAILLADGDRMGKVIATRKKKEDHIRFSDSLSQFADKAREIVQRYNGCMVYSGGDDVLAFLPLDCCLQAARSLHECFGDLLKEYEIPDSDQDGAKTKSPTLSIGIAIGHSMESLEDMLEFARDAENAAKKGANSKDERNGLAIHVHPRSGVPIKIREQWNAEGENGLDERLKKWAKMYNEEELPDRAAYDLHELAEDYRNWTTSSDEDRKNLGGIISDDALRLLKRKRSSHGKEALNEDVIGDFRNMLKGINSYEGISGLANELIIARRISSSMKQANHAKKTKENVKEVVH
jgi:CRISPR-associated protein Cmr2